MSSPSSNQAVFPSVEKSKCLSRGLKLYTALRWNCDLAHFRNSTTVQRSVASVPIKTPLGRELAEVAGFVGDRGGLMPVIEHRADPLSGSLCGRG